MTSIDGKIMHVWNLLHNRPEAWLNLRFMLISETAMLRLNKGYMSEVRQLDELALIRGVGLNRGKILDLFIKLEIIITDLVIARLVGLFERAPKLEGMVEKMDIGRKKVILQGCGMFDQDLSSRLDSLFRVRNGLAHSWSMEEVKYLNDPLRYNLIKFKEDFEITWKKIIQIYMQEQAPKIDSFIAKIESEISDP